VRGRGDALAMTLLTSASLKILQEQTIIACLSLGYRVNGSANGISRRNPLGASVMSDAPSECLVAKAGA
jgi:hypothetical protein